MKEWAKRAQISYVTFTNINKTILPSSALASTPTPVEAEVSFNISFSTPPTHLHHSPTPPHPTEKVVQTHLIKKLLLQNVSNFYQRVQNWLCKQEMELSKQEMELFLLLSELQ